MLPLIDSYCVIVNPLDVTVDGYALKGVGYEVGIVDVITTVFKMLPSGFWTSDFEAWIVLYPFGGLNTIESIPLAYKSRRL